MVATLVLGTSVVRRAGSSPALSTYSGMEQLVARWAHNPKVTGSSPVPATMSKRYSAVFGPRLI
jgi:hypothetical protein